jgi:hypothetical protein
VVDLDVPAKGDKLQNILPGECRETVLVPPFMGGIYPYLGKT